MQRGNVAQVAAGPVKRLLALLHDRIVNIAARRNTQRMQVEVDVFHILRRNLYPVMTVSEHLRLPFGHFQRITVVRDAQVGRKSQFDRQVGMLRLIARHADILPAALGNVVQPAGNPVFGIVAASGELFELDRVKRHHLPHADMAQRNADVDDQILRSDAVGIPSRNGIGRRNQRILLPVGKSVGLLGV